MRTPFASLLCLSVAAGLALAPARLRAEPLAQAEVAELLAAGVERPASLGRLSGASAGEVAALIAVYEDTSAPRHARLRALNVLAGSGRPEARAYLRGLIDASSKQAPTADELHPARAAGVVLRALRGFHAQPAGLSTDSLAACLQHAQPAVRAEAVRLLRAQGTRASRALLAAHGAREQSPRVQAAFR